MQIEEISYKRNDDGTYYITMTQKRNDKLITYGFPKVEIEWSKDNSISINSYGTYIPQVINTRLCSSGDNNTLINFDITEENN